MCPQPVEQGILAGSEAMIFAVGRKVDSYPDRGGGQILPSVSP